MFTSKRSVTGAAIALAAGLVFGGGVSMTAQAEEWQPLETTAPRVDNPLKGFVPFGIELDHEAANFPYSMEWFYLPLDSVVKGDKVYDWTQFEQNLEAISDRGNQSVLRFYLDYPGKDSGVPDYLLGPDGIDQSRRYDLFDNDGKSFSPDYNDPRVQALITDFVDAFGARYDGDPRIGFITTGLVGFWGEQHTWPMNGYADAAAGNPDGEQWMPEPEVEKSFYYAWDEAFDTTKLLNRYPYAGLEDINVGFHDDSFAVSTLPNVDWHFMAHMQANNLTDRWQTEAIGGEIQPPIQLCVFDDPPSCENPASEDFDEAVQATHVSWLMNHRAFTTGYEGAARDRALAAHASLGYDLAVTEARIHESSGATNVTVRITNRGVAPFYYDWPLQFAILGQDGAVLAKKDVFANLPTILPGQTVEVQALLPDVAGLVALSIPNPMDGGAPLKFANAAQDRDVEGYLSLGQVTGAAPGPKPTATAPSPSDPTAPGKPGQPGLPSTGN